MYMGLYIVAILGIIILIQTIVVLKLIEKDKQKSYAYEYRIDQFRKSHKDSLLQVSQLEKKQNSLKLSIANLTNALKLKPLDEGKRHVNICEIKDGQKIVVIIDEVFRYRVEYYQQMVGDIKNQETFINYREFECMAFIDGKLYDPLIVNPIQTGDTFAELEDINCGQFIGRGMGSVVLESLVSVLKQIGIQKLEAGLSVVDYPRKDKLYKFYIEYNGFELVKELTENHWGRVVKKW